jgi:hypothetical protein
MSFPREWDEIEFLERVGRSSFFVQHRLYRVRPYHETDTHTFVHVKHGPELPIDRQATRLLRLESLQSRMTWSFPILSLGANLPERSQDGAPGTGSVGPIRRAASPPTLRTHASTGKRWGKKKNRSARKPARRHQTPSRRHNLIGVGLTCGASTRSILDCLGELWIGLEVTYGAGIIGPCAVVRARSRPSRVFRGARQGVRMGGTRWPILPSGTASGRPDSRTHWRALGRIPRRLGTPRLLTS